MPQGSPPMKCRTMRGRELSRGTICFIGAVTIMPASAPAPIAASRETAPNMRSPSRKSPEAWLEAVATSGHGIEQTRL